MDSNFHILRPHSKEEAIGTAEASRRSGIPARRIREWCHDHHIGRIIGGRMAVSAVALDMFLEGDEAAFDAYLKGDRESPAVTTYYERRKIPIPRYPESPPAESDDRITGKNGVTLARVSAMAGAEVE